ncbi:DgyrCDS14968 [Dimorphilus gyrociliatus]|uniref:DgyrCDS14968 n=1 Tax=Dimorphilus gyrociliatus TaxID=2664684 RepID=A0A7I8WFJ2_9ANNE|nr:DgyrCDS14968 [Dimorphilus gyrociliatus]
MKMSILNFIYNMTFVLIFRKCIIVGGISSRDSKLINVARKSNGAMCTRSSTFPTAKYNFECEFALKPFWIDYNDWAALCSNANCKQHWIEITFTKIYDVIEFCTTQRLVDPSSLMTAIKVTMGTNPTRIYHINILTTCLLLEDGDGSSSSKAKFEAESYMSGNTRNIGFNDISIFALENENVHNGDKLTNTAFKHVGASCSASSSRSTFECSEALDRDITKTWSPNCDVSDSLKGSCVNHYIDVALAFPAEPKLLCISNGHQFTNRIKTVRVEWSSGFNQTVNLPNADQIHCFNYTNSFGMEHGLKLTIMDVYIDKNVGFQYVSVFVKDSSKLIYLIQSENFVVYHLSPYVYQNFRAIKFQILGVNLGQTDDCSSFIIAFKSETSIQLTIKLNEIINNNKISSMEVTNQPSIQISSLPLFSCDDWKSFWLEMSESHITFGLGMEYGISRLATISSAISIKPRQILFKNGLSNIKNGVRVVDEDGIKLENFYHDCTNNEYYKAIDPHIYTCTPLKERNSLFHYKLSNGNGFRSNSTFSKVVLKKTDTLLGDFNVNIFIKLDNADGKLCKQQQTMIEKNSYFHFPFECEARSNKGLDNLHILIHIYELSDIPKLSLCDISVDF